MTLYLDTEFNGHAGQLISLALVSSSSPDYFYGVLPIAKHRYVESWVIDNVLPHLNQDPEPLSHFRDRLRAFLQRYAGKEIVADWPGDFAHLMGLMCGPSYDKSFIIPCTLVLVESGDLQSDTPHNALSDARALMKWHRVKEHEENEARLAFLRRGD
ncbi:MAG TPA: hypothetical protein VLJ17_24625 [Xanthobacteraceae bacterium]|nr:hypothetical protein [Xanthobacteraceae bacterium]